MSLTNPIPIQDNPALKHIGLTSDASAPYAAIHSKGLPCIAIGAGSGNALVGIEHAHAAQEALLVIASGTHARAYAVANHSFIHPHT